VNGTDDSCTGEDGNGSLWTAGRPMDDPPPTGDGPPSPIWTNGVTDPLSGDSTEVCISPWSLNRRSGGGLSKTVPLIAFLARSDSSIGRLRSVSLLGGRVGPGCRPIGRPSPGNALVGEVALSISISSKNSLNSFSGKTSINLLSRKSKTSFC